MNRASAQAQGGLACMYVCMYERMHVICYMYACMHVCMHVESLVAAKPFTHFTIKFLYFYIKVKAWASEAWVAANPFTCYYNEILICLKSG